jgi:hypothetical protein
VNTTAWRGSALLVLAGLGMASAHAQDQGNCPQMPEGSGLTWEYRSSGDSDFCRALRADGSEAFGLYIARKSPFEPKRGNRAEAGVIDGQQMYWYKGELATRPNLEVRETLMELADGRVAHIWLQAEPQQLGATISEAQSIRFPSTRLSSK